MSDKTFEIGLTVFSAVVLLCLVLGIVFNVFAWSWVVLIAIVVELVGGGTMLHYWGKTYMARE
jgi:5-bromo-4-chloroindolyl phosphate hydrolysis protein